MSEYFKMNDLLTIPRDVDDELLLKPPMFCNRSRLFGQYLTIVFDYLGALDIPISRHMLLCVEKKTQIMCFKSSRLTGDDLPLLDFISKDTLPPLNRLNLF